MKDIKLRKIVIIFGAAVLVIMFVVLIFSMPVGKRRQVANSAFPPPEPPVLYDSAAGDKIVSKMENRVPLLARDLSAKKAILAALPAGAASGVLYVSPKVVIDYTSSADLFQAEIMTVDIAAAKEEAVKWFKDNGMDQEGICDLPVEFYLNANVAESFRGKGFIFNPLPPGC